MAMRRVVWIGHSGFFRRQFADSLWPHALAILDNMSSKRQPT